MIIVKVKTQNSVDTVTITSNDVEKSELHGKNIESQKLEDISPINDGKNMKHEGYSGLLINGVEILNYKSKNSVYYGELNNLVVVDGGEKYDVINPPILSITIQLGATRLVL